METPIQPGLSDAKRRLLNRYLSGNASSPPAIPQRTASDVVSNVVPQSFYQEQVWTHIQWMGEKPAYNELVTIHRHGPLDVRSLERTFDEMNRRHEIWRTTFGMGPSWPAQTIHDAAPPVELRVVDLRTLPKDDRSTESERLAAANGRIPFDLTSLPLWRAVLAQIADEEFHLHLNLHQLVTDGVSLYRILLPEMIARYSEFSQGWPSPSPGPAPQYGDFALWQRAQLTDRFLAPHLAWWKQRLAAPAPHLGWPGYKPRPPMQTYNGATEMLFLPLEFVDPLRRFAEGESATLFMALAASFFTLLHRYTGQTDLILGMPAGARPPGTEAMMGYFVNLLPIRVDLSGNPGFREVLKRVRTSVVEALEHGSVPLTRLLREVRPPRDPSRNPLFQIMMSLEPPMLPIDPSWDLTQARVSSGSAKADLYLNLDTRPDGMMVQIVYNPDLLEAQNVRSMFADWRAISEGGIALPDRPVSELSTLRPPIRHSFGELLRSWLKR